jgi:hypothetical protein
LRSASPARKNGRNIFFEGLSGNGSDGLDAAKSDLISAAALDALSAAEDFEVRGLG